MADTKLSALSTGTTPDYSYGEEGGASKKYSGLKRFNVLDYGADSTGVASSTAAIQAAVYAAAVTYGGGRVIIPRGTYLITQSADYAYRDGGVNLGLYNQPWALVTENGTTAGVTITSANPGVFTWVGNTLANGDLVSITTTGALPTNIAQSTPYYVVSNGVDGAGKFRLAATSGGAAINTTAGVQSGSHTIRSTLFFYTSDRYIASRGGIYYKAVIGGATFTVTIASPGVFTWAGNALANGDPVQLATTGALPTGLVAGTVYFVVNNGTDGAGKFRLAATSGGAAINTSGSQSGTHTIYANVARDPATDVTDTWWTPLSNVIGDACYVVIEGDGYNSFLTGDFNGFLLDRSAHNGIPHHIKISHLRLKNNNAGAGAGCIRIVGVDGATICDNDMQGHICVQAGGYNAGIILPDGTAAPSPTPTAGSAFTTSIRNNTLTGLNTIPESGSRGVIMGMHAACFQNSISRLERAIQGYGTGSTIFANRLEVNDIAIFLGQDASGASVLAQGYHVYSNSFEANRDGIYIFSAASCMFSAMVLTDGTNGPYFPNRSHLRLYSGQNLVFSGMTFGAMTTPLKGAVYAEGNMGGISLFVNCAIASWASEALSAQYYHLFRFINCTLPATSPPNDGQLTFAQLPDNSTFIPVVGELYVVTDARKSGGGTAVAGDTIASGGAQQILTTWNGTVYKAVAILG